MSSSNNPSSIVPNSGRIQTLDILRGFAMLGIFISIVGGFNSSIIYGHRLGGEGTTLDHLIGTFHSAFVGLRFIGIFSLLFGIGIAIQEKNAEVKGLRFFPQFTRRSFGLLAMGACVISFVYHAEILFAYAIIGFLTYLITRINLKLALAVAIFSLVLYGSLFEVIARPGLLEEFKGFRKVIRFKEFFAAYQAGPWLTQIKVRWIEYIILYADNGFHMGTSFAMMIFGYVIAIKDLHKKFLNNLKGYSPIFGIALFITATFGLFAFATNQTFFLITENPVGAIFWVFFQVCSTFTYIYIICWISSFEKLNSLTQFLANNGRMSLSTYVGGATIMALIFYHPGLGLYTQFGTAKLTLIGVGIYFFCTLCNFLWLKKFSQGPLEWVLRKVTYWH